MALLEIQPTAREILERNRLEYDDAVDPYWVHTVYEPTHAGWCFANIGGRTVLDAICREAPLRPGDHALEICCGMGDTCRYIAENSGCSVTGVEWNPRQVERAMGRRGLLPAGLASRLRFLKADAQAWRPDCLYDAVYAVEGLMCLADRDAALDSCVAALRPRGAIFLAEVFAGPAMSAELARFIWEEDGILNLPTPEEQCELLRARGLDTAFGCLAPLSLNCFGNMVRESEKHRELLVKAKGAERFARWLRNARIYLRAFETGELTYALVRGRKSA